MRAWVFGLLAAIVIHGMILLFGGLLFPKHEADAPRVVREVDLLTDDPDEEKKDEEKQEPVEEQKPVEAEQDTMEEDVQRPPEPSPEPATNVAEATPALEALSLEALEGMLSGAVTGTGSDFVEGASLASGGRIGGTGAPGGTEAEQAVEEIFAMADLDQRPRALAQASPVYPMELRKKKVAGVVYVMFVVDDSGRVQNPKVERASDPGFERPAIDAVRQWRFEPATRGGRKVAVRMRIPIRFSAEG